MKKIFLIAAVIISQLAVAQVKKVSLQASGLTCSMCSNAINKSLKSLSFVDKITADIKSSTFELTFKPGADIDFDKVKNKVEAAGFSVSKFVAVIDFNGESISNEAHLNKAGKTFQFLDVKPQSLNGEKQVTFLDKGYVSSKVFKKNTSLTSMACYKTGVAEACCAKDKLVKGSRIFHVTI